MPQRPDQVRKIVLCDTSLMSLRLVALCGCSTRFTLHGLWPNYEKGHCPGKKGAWPQNCDDSSTDLPPECDCPFDVSLLADLQSTLLDNWPSYGQANADFWEHEWDKHGMLASPNLISSSMCLSAHLYTGILQLHAFWAELELSLW